MTAIVDYGVGNLFSLSSSLKALGLETIITRHGNDDPEIVSAAGGKGHFDGFAQRGGFRRYRAKGAADDVHILSHGDQLAGKRHFGVIKDPAHNDGVTNAEAQGRKDRHAADQLAGPFGFTTVLHGPAE